MSTTPAMILWRGVGKTGSFSANSKVVPGGHFCDNDGKRTGRGDLTDLGHGMVKWLCVTCLPEGSFDYLYVYSVLWIDRS